MNQGANVTRMIGCISFLLSFIVIGIVDVPESASLFDLVLAYIIPLFFMVIGVFLLRKSINE